MGITLGWPGSPVVFEPARCRLGCASDRHYRESHLSARPAKAVNPAASRITSGRWRVVALMRRRTYRAASTYACYLHVGSASAGGRPPPTASRFPLRSGLDELS